MKQARVSEVLDDLIEINREEEACYRICLQYLNKDPARRALKRRAQRAARARRHLAKLRDAMGRAECVGPALSPAPVNGSACAFGAVSDQASALGMCERVHAIVLMRYRDALDFELPEPVRKLLQCQFDALLEQPAITVPPVVRKARAGASGSEAAVLAR